MTTTHPDAIELLLDVFVPGEPAPKGSIQPFIVWRGGKPTPAARADNPESQRAWHDAIAAVVRAARGGLPAVDGPVHVHADFVMPRRKSAPRTTTPAHTRKPDGDKVTRCTWDALTGTLLADDAQVVSWSGSKREAEPGEQSGALLRVELLPAAAPVLIVAGAA